MPEPRKTTDEDANRGGEIMELDAVAAGPKRFYEPAIRRPRPARARGDEPPPRSYRGTAHAGTRCASSANSRTRSRFWRALARFRRASVMPGAASALTRFRQGRLTAAWKAFDVRSSFPMLPKILARRCDDTTQACLPWSQGRAAGTAVGGGSHGSGDTIPFRGLAATACRRWLHVHLPGASIADRPLKSLHRH